MDYLARTEGFELLLVSNPDIWDAFDPCPLGVLVRLVNFRERRLTAGGDQHDLTAFLDVFVEANALSFAQRGLGIPSWVVIDLAVSPSALLLLTAPPSVVARRAGELLASDPYSPNGARGVRARSAAAALQSLLYRAETLGYDGPLPVAGYGAAATPIPGRWFGWSAWSLLPGLDLGYAIKRLALACYRTRLQSGVTQFDNAEALHLHTKFGPLLITAARLDAHTAAHTFSYDVDVSDLPADGWPAQVDLQPTDELAMADIDEWAGRMQDEIAGESHQHFILSPAAGSDVIPVFRRTR
jgi:hypothetical protein